MNTEIREMVESYMRLNLELDAIGGPEKNGELFETIIEMEEEILGAAELPPAEKYRRILWGDDAESVIEELDGARDEYAHRPIRNTALMLVDAVLRQVDEPGNILPMVGLSHHTYQVFLFHKLLDSSGPAELDDIMTEMKKAEESLDEIGRLGSGGIKKYPELYIKLREIGINRIDEFLMRAGTFDIDDEDMNAYQFYLRGAINAEDEKLDDAIRDFTSAIEADPEWTAIYYHRGRAYDDKDEVPRAIDDYTRVIDDDPGHYGALCRRGILFALVDMHEEALEDYNNAITARPKIPLAYFNRGHLHSEMGEHELAIDDYTRTLALDPENGYAYCNRGISYYEIGRKERALDDMKKSAALGHENARKFLEEFFPGEIH